MNSVINVFPTVYAKMNDSGQNARIRSETVRDRGAQTTFNDQVSLYLLAQLTHEVCTASN